MLPFDAPAPWLRPRPGKAFAQWPQPGGGFSLVSHPQTYPRLGAFLNIPADQTLYEFYRVDPHGFPNYYFDLLATECTPENARHAPLFYGYRGVSLLDLDPGFPERLAPRSAPVVDTFDLGDGWRPVLLAWRRRVCCREQPWWIEACFTVERCLNIAICGIDDGIKDTDLPHIQTGLKLLKVIERRGRPAVGWEVASAQYAKATQLYHAHLERTGDRPSQLEVASCMGISERTLIRYRGFVKKPWPPA